MYRDISVSTHNGFTVIRQNDYDSIPSSNVITPFRTVFIVIDPDGLVLDEAESLRLGRIFLSQPLRKQIYLSMLAPSDLSLLSSNL